MIGDKKEAEHDQASQLYLLLGRNPPFEEFFPNASN